MPKQETEWLALIPINNNEREYILSNSIERVINNAIHVGSLGESQLKHEGDREDASILWQDCEELKPLLCKIWSRLQNDLFDEKP